MSTALVTTSVPAGTWVADPAHTSIEFKVKHMMFASVKGRFDAYEATLVSNDDGLALDATIDVASLDSKAGQRDEHLRSPDFFDAERFPQIRFRSTRVDERDGKLTVAGELTIRDVTREVVLEGELATGVDPWGNERVLLELEGELDRTDYGLTWNQALEAGGVLVGDTVKLAVDAQAVRAQG